MTHINTFLLTLFFILVFKISFSQLPGAPGGLDVVGSGGTGLTNYGGLHNGFINKSKVVGYGDVDGSCFWDEKWNQAILFLVKGEKIKLPKARLNFYTNDIHYFDDKGEEFTLVKGIVQKIVFLDANDTTKVLGVFKKFKNTNESYVEILNEGKTQLLKLTQITLRKMDFNQYRNESRYRFIPRSKYMINNQDTLVQLTGLNKSSLFSVLHSNNEIKGWLNSNHNKLRNEKEVISFLDFYNSK